MLPTGTITFLFTDIQGSTPLWEREPEKMAAALQVHNAALRRAIESNGGVVFKVVGDAFNAAFSTAPQALKAAIEGQRALESAPWNELGALKVRMGIHTGEAELDPGGDEYAVSHTKNRVSRIMSAGHGGQILLSQECADLVMRSLPEGVALKDMGEHHLKGLLHPEHLFQVLAPGLEDNFPPLKSESRPSHNLPLELTAFIGRQQEIVQVQKLLQEHRLVTLTGSGGVGKTRLSIQVAEQMLADTPDGVWYVELAPISDPDLVPQIVATTLGLREEPNRPLSDTLVHFLSSRQLLLVLDNCEHLLGACARLADNLLRKSPRLRIFVSSREPLGIGGEYTFRVPSLTTPDPHQMPALGDFQEYEAVRLFTVRARAALPSFQVNEHNAPAIAQICQRLDGIPLALELAAVRLNMLTTEQLASRLDNAFRLLTGGSRTALPRQQTLRAAIDWSYQLLSDPEQRLLRRLAVFAGGGILEAIESVCAGEGLEAEQILDLLTGLVNKSMVSVDRKQEEETRYWLLETVRQFAREKLYDAKESTVFFDRFFDHFLELAESIEPQLRTSIALERLHVLNREVDNLRASLSWALDGDTSPRIEAGLRLASALLNFWHTQSFHNEGYSWLNKGLSALPEGNLAYDGIRARACFAAGHLIIPIGRLEEARQWLLKSLKIYQRMGDTTGIVMSQSMLGETLAWMGSFDEGKKLCEASLAVCRTLDAPWLLAWVLCRYGLCLFFHNEYTQAQPLLEESLSIFEKVGDRLQVGDHFIMLGLIAYDQGDYSRSRDYNNKCLTSARAMKSKWTEGNALHNLGQIAYMQKDYSQMQTYLKESVAVKRETGNLYNLYLAGTLPLLGIAELRLTHPKQAILHFKECLNSSNDSRDIIASLIGIAGAAIQTSQPLVAARLLGAVIKLVDAGTIPLDAIYQKEFDQAWLKAKEGLDGAAFEQALSEGQTMTLEQAVAYALEVIDG